MQGLQKPLSGANSEHASRAVRLSGANLLENSWQSGHTSLQLHRASHRPCRSRHACRLLCMAGKGFGARAANPPRKKPRPGSPDADVAAWEVNPKLCPCGSGGLYEVCCERYHAGELEPTAEAVMRARFSAYVKGELAYIAGTTHPDNPALEGTKRKGTGEVVSTFREDVRATYDKVRWLRLKILKREAGSTEDEAFVTFQIQFKWKNQQGQRQRGTRTETSQEKR